MVAFLLSGAHSGTKPELTLFQSGDKERKEERNPIALVASQTHFHFEQKGTNSPQSLAVLSVGAKPAAPKRLKLT